MKNKIPQHIVQICEVLNRAGYEAYLVGGAVRDLLLGREPKDWDVATSAPPETVQAVFPRTIPTGIQHGTVTVQQGPAAVEVTTFRGESDHDGRRPGRVEFLSSIEADLARRDLTINAIAFDPIRDILVDPFGGEQDLIRRRIRTVGAPEDRFREDGLRILRALRFTSALQFEIDSNIFEGASACLEVLEGLSRERIRDELLKILGTDRPDLALGALADLGAVQLLFGFDPSPEYWVRAISELSPEDQVGRLAAFFWPLRSRLKSQPQKGAEKFLMDQLKLPSKLNQEVVRILQFDQDLKVEGPPVLWGRRLLVRFDLAEIWIRVRRAFRCEGVCSGTDCSDMEEVRQALLGAVFVPFPRKVSDLAISGSDLIRLGIQPGPELGRILQELHQEVLEDPLGRNQSGWLQNRVRAGFKDHSVGGT